jgi:hypothetical protein
MCVIDRLDKEKTNDFDTNNKMSTPPRCHVPTSAAQSVTPSPSNTIDGHRKRSSIENQHQLPGPNGKQITTIDIKPASNILPYFLFPNFPSSSLFP